jgi:hypothetical protein
MNKLFISTKNVILKNVILKFPKPTFEKFKTINEQINIIHQFLIRFAVVVGICTLSYYLIKEISSNKYVLTSIEISHSIGVHKKDSLRLYSNDLRQKIIKEIEGIVETSNAIIGEEDFETESYTNDPTTINVGGFDLNQLFLYFRSFFNLQNREIKFYVYDNNNDKEKYPYSVSYKVGNKEKRDLPFSTPSEIERFFAKKIVEYNSPYYLGLYLLNAQKPEDLEIKRIISRLDTLTKYESFWERSFQNNLWEEKSNILSSLNFLKTTFDEKETGNFIKKNRKLIIEPNESNCSVILKSIEKINCDRIGYLKGLKTNLENRGNSLFFTKKSLLKDSTDKTKMDSLNFEIERLNNKIELGEDSLKILQIQINIIQKANIKINYKK